MITKAARKALRNKRAAAKSATADDPYYQGDAAYYAGQSLSTNPYYGKPGGEDWALGWFEARNFAQSR